MFFFSERELCNCNKTDKPEVNVVIKTYPMILFIDLLRYCSILKLQ